MCDKVVKLAHKYVKVPDKDTGNLSVDFEKEPRLVPAERMTRS